MRLLLDTHAFLWFINGDVRLPLHMVNGIRDVNNDVYLSPVTTWELSIKYATGKLSLPQAPGIYVPLKRQLYQIASLPIDEVSATHLDSLPPIHNDPFDRMLICQALAHGMTLVTVDAHVRAYQVPVL